MPKIFFVYLSMIEILEAIQGGYTILEDNVLRALEQVPEAWHELLTIIQ